MEGHLAAEQSDVAVRDELGLDGAAHQVVQVVAALEDDAVRGVVQRLDDDARVVELAADRVQRVLVAAVVVHDRHVVVADVALLVGARRIRLLGGHQRRHVEYHLRSDDSRRANEKNTLSQANPERAVSIKFQRVFGIRFDRAVAHFRWLLHHSHQSRPDSRRER